MLSLCTNDPLWAQILPRIAILSRTLLTSAGPHFHGIPAVRRPHASARTAIRPKRKLPDYDAVGELLVRTYRAPGPHRNWPQQRREYMHAHPLCDESLLSGFGVWESNGRIVGIVHHVHHPGIVYVQVDPACAFLKPDMLAYAAENLAVGKICWHPRRKAVVWVVWDIR